METFQKGGIFRAELMILVLGKVKHLNIILSFFLHQGLAMHQDLTKLLRCTDLPGLTLTLNELVCNLEELYEAHLTAESLRTGIQIVLVLDSLYLLFDLVLRLL